MIYYNLNNCFYLYIIVTLDMNKHFTIQASNDTDWDDYLNQLHVYMTDQGFRRYNQSLKREDFAYWKKYGDKYQIGIYVYDFRKFNRPELKTGVSVMFECMLHDINCRCDITVNKDLELHEFEKMAEDFYNTMAKYF